MEILFSDVFGVAPKEVEDYGAFDVSLVSDLPLFVDPFLIFNSHDSKYQRLHKEIVKYLLFLHKKSQGGWLPDGLIEAWYCFPEVKENWLGFSTTGNKGRGLGRKFANALHSNLHTLFDDFERTRITKDIHLEKLCLIESGVGKDSISDFTNNLIHQFLLEYTEKFAVQHIQPALRQRKMVSKVRFNYVTETWRSDEFELPIFDDQHVLLTPTNILTKGDTWINRADLVDGFDWIPDAVSNRALRDQINNYFRSLLPKRRKRPSAKEKSEAVRLTLLRFPDLVDYYIRYKEDRGDEATRISASRVVQARGLYLKQFAQLPSILRSETDFYADGDNTLEAARKRAHFLKDAIESKGCHRLFYSQGKSIEREADLQILYRMTWYGTTYDISREVNDGRGPADFKVSRGAFDKSLVEMKLAGNSHLKRNLRRQSPIYERASDAKATVKVIICFNQAQIDKVHQILAELKMTHDPNVVVIDARMDNKPSGSKA